MSKIVLAKGDCHGDPYDLIAICDHFRKRNIDLNNVVIFVAGDFGIPWPGHPQETIDKLTALDSTGATIIAVLGNHEWWSLVYSMPQGMLYGGNVHQCFFNNVWYKNIHYVTDPTVMNIDNKSYLLIPGADSHDIRDGILYGLRPIRAMETYREWSAENLKNVQEYEDNFVDEHGYYPQFRIDGITWWREEHPQIDKVNEILNTYRGKEKFQAVISHDAPGVFAYESQRHKSIWDRYPVTEAERQLEDIYNKINFKYWVHGHFHSDAISRTDPRVIVSYYVPKVLSENFSLTTDDKYDMISSESNYWYDY